MSRPFNESDRIALKEKIARRRTIHGPHAIGDAQEIVRQCQRDRLSRAIERKRIMAFIDGFMLGVCAALIIAWSLRLVG